MPPLQKVSGERSQFSARFKAALESTRGLQPSPTLVAREFNNRFVGRPVTVHAVRKWLVGEAIPTQDKLRALAKWLEVSVEWLRFGGAGERDAADAGVYNAALFFGQSAGTRLLPQDQLIQLFLTLPSRERKLAQEFVTMLRKKRCAHVREHLYTIDDIRHITHF
ncbi:MAG: hypothetical protein V4695_09780 [Pseudomonadota bacterium]